MLLCTYKKYVGIRMAASELACGRKRRIYMSAGTAGSEYDFHMFTPYS